MSHAASAKAAEPTNMQLEEGAIVSAAVNSASAAAATPMSDLSDLASATNVLAHALGNTVLAIDHKPLIRTSGAVPVGSAHLRSKPVLADSVQQTTTQMERRGSVQRVNWQLPMLV